MKGQALILFWCVTFRWDVRLVHNPGPGNLHHSREAGRKLGMMSVPARVSRYHLSYHTSLPFSLSLSHTFEVLAHFGDEEK